MHYTYYYGMWGLGVLMLLSGIGGLTNLIISGMGILKIDF